MTKYVTYRFQTQKSLPTTCRQAFTTGKDLTPLPRQFLKLGTNIRLPHQRLTDQKGLGTIGLQPFDIDPCVDTALRHQQTSRGERNPVRRRRYPLFFSEPRVWSGDTLLLPGTHPCSAS